MCGYGEGGVCLSKERGGGEGVDKTQRQKSSLAPVALVSTEGVKKGGQKKKKGLSLLLYKMGRKKGRL